MRTILVRYASDGQGNLSPARHLVQYVVAHYFPVEGCKRVRTESGDVWDCIPYTGQPVMTKDRNGKTLWITPNYLALEPVRG